MTTDLRDLEADRRLLEGCSEFKGGAPTIWAIADSALDEIDRLKRLLVSESETFPGRWYTNIDMPESEWAVKAYPTEAAAWAAVRKAANDGK